MANQSKNDPRAELRSWYLRGLQPKLARAASRGAVDPRAAAELDDEVRRLLRVSDRRRIPARRAGSPPP